MADQPSANSRERTSGELVGGDSLAQLAVRVAGGDSASEDELIARLEPLIPTLFAIVRQNRPKNAKARIHSTGVVYDALFDLVKWLRSRGANSHIEAQDIRQVLLCITQRRLRDEIRTTTQDRRDPAREVASTNGQPSSTPASAVPVTDLPRQVQTVIEDSIPPAPAENPPRSSAAHNPHLATAAEELVVWLEQWAEELRQIHEMAIEIIEYSFCGWTPRQIGEILDLSERTVQLKKEKLLTVLERKLGLERTNNAPDST